MPKIESLSAMPSPAFYRRSTGETFAKLNERFHVRAKLGKYGNNETLSLLGDGTAEEFDPNEEVEVIHWKQS